MLKMSRPYFSRRISLLIVAFISLVYYLFLPLLISYLFKVIPPQFLQIVYWGIALSISFFAVLIGLYFPTYRASQLFNLEKIKGELTFCMRPISFARMGRKCKGDRDEIAKYFLRDFTNGAVNAAEKFPPGTTFHTTTWLFDELKQKFLIKKGFIVEKADQGKVSRFVIGLSAFMVYGNWNELRKIRETQFYKFTWTKETLKGLRITNTPHFCRSPWLATLSAMSQRDRTQYQNHELKLL
ncbi:hypothetical protein SAMN02745215_05019 [Desulfitobacterium chlororespirans DSM 11544]|uniref:Uncharacterized protein n=1 Tax=Desulfitobacterium chlororespirans DSM 11544 TaxID=1121395 RepID=A0A1M7UY89_9FIRM|nr:hypothetical protein SAMN02745215_05019 [Desulfitobacterium chlororespirans DSM 11544]